MVGTFLADNWNLQGREGENDLCNDILESEIQIKTYFLLNTDRNCYRYTCL